MRFKYYYHNALLVEALNLFEGDAEIEALVAKLKDPNVNPKEKEKLQKELRTLINQKQKNKGGSGKEGLLANFAKTKGLTPEQVEDVLKKTDPTKKYQQVIIKWWNDDTFEPKNAMLLRQVLKNYEEHKDKVGDITKFKSPQELENSLDQIVHQKTSYQQTLDINDPPIYEDDYVRVFHGSDRNRCIHYGKGTQHTLCVARPNHSNLFLGYRSRGATFYFIYFKKKEAENNQLKEGVDFIVVHVYPDHMELNQVEPNKDVKITDAKLLKKFPVLKGFMSSKKMKHIKHSQDEKELFKIDEYDSILDCKNYKEVETYIEIGKLVTNDDNEWEELEKRGYDIKPLVVKYVETGAGDVPLDIIDKFKLRKRYDAILNRRVGEKLKNDDLVEYTSHEIRFMDDNQRKQLLSYMAGIEIDKDMSLEEFQKMAVQENGEAIQFINNPSEELQRLAVEEYSRAIRFIKNPSEEVKRIANAGN